jgi:hypothetical protein
MTACEGTLNEVRTTLRAKWGRMVDDESGIGDKVSRFGACGSKCT